ncbi:MAG TPA: hypothetical protein VEC57_16235 [Candidatus Limnocylindrales bacterium]|nr:hypothetical protein [Candidatus Limnocylindrales bacterium]
MMLPVLSLILCLLATPAAADIIADDALDVCTATADPCTIHQRIEIVNGSVLDFGTRGLVVGAGGLLDFGSGGASVLAGNIVVGGLGIDVQGPESGGLVTIAADGTLVIQALVNGRTVDPGTIFLEATNNVVIASTIDMRGSTLDSDGGSVCIESYEGSVAIHGLIKTDAGRFGLGGDIDLTAVKDVSVQAALTALGGDTDGGDITIYADRDVLISADVSATAVGGAGYGGDIDIEAVRDIIISGGTDADRTVVESRGHEDEDSFSGDGGDISLAAERNIVVGQFAVLVSEGSAPDGYSGYLTVEAEGAVTHNGRIEAVADGGEGEGGDIELTAVGPIQVGSTGFLVVDAANVGSIALDSEGSVTLDGTFSLIGKPGGTGGTFEVDALGDIDAGGDVMANRPETEVDWMACRIRLEPTAAIDNNSVDGLNLFVVRESMRLAAGSSLLTKPSGQNKLVYRDEGKPPVMLGTVTPAPQLVVDTTLQGCPVCGNGEVDAGEPCDDGNSVDTDACLTGCIAASCGDGLVEEGVEECDDQNANETDGCSVTCDTLTCGDATGDENVVATDSLRILQSAVGQPVACHAWACDVDNNGRVLASDALIVLRFAVGLPVELMCAPLVTTTTTTTSSSTTTTQPAPTTTQTTTTTFVLPTTTTLPAPTTTIGEPTTTLPTATTTLPEPTTTLAESTTTLPTPTTTLASPPTTTIPQ